MQPLHTKHVILIIISPALTLAINSRIEGKKQVENSLELNLMFDALIESPYMAYVIVNKDGNITKMNQTYLDILELKKEEVVGKHILKVTPQSKLPDVLRTGKIDRADIWPIKGRDTIVTRLPIVKNDEIIGAIGQSLFLEMSSVQILLKKLQETFNTMSDALVQSPHMIYVIVNKAGYITFMNQTYLDMLDKRIEDVIGKHIHEITLKSRLPEVIETGQIHEVDLWEVNGQDTIITRAPIIRDGEIVGAIGQSLFLDMSGAKLLVNRLQEMKKELYLYKEEVRQIYKANWYFNDLVGRSLDFSLLKSIAHQLSITPSTLLITGESGTGKELFAQAIHNASNREHHPFVRINCAALPESLLESELFGYEEGAFSGARKGGKPGKFELAKGGTIFLDEIGDMPLDMQTKLLTVMQERVIERVGGTRPIPIDVRVIAATNRDLEELVKNQLFREDLYYRLNVVRLSIPPLRKRMEDIPLLIEVLMKKINNKLKADTEGISDAALDLLKSYAWPGNVRELENLLERAVNMACFNSEKILELEHFPSLNHIDNLPSRQKTSDHNLNKAIEDLEKGMITNTLMLTNNNKAQAAQLMGLNKSVFYRKLKKYGLMEIKTD